MGDTDERAKSTGEQIEGKVKQGVGHLTGDEQMHAEGQATEAKGDLREAKEGVKDAVRDAAEGVDKATR
jgi:uncharacterized protein YjbJ (UPF0337 family)